MNSKVKFESLLILIVLITSFINKGYSQELDLPKDILDSKIMVDITTTDYIVGDKKYIEDIKNNLFETGLNIALITLQSPLSSDKNTVDEKRKEIDPIYHQYFRWRN